jgi:hypothetical protein
MSAPLTATLALSQAGTTLATLPLPLTPPDARGRIQQVGQLPLTPLLPGFYTLALTVSGGSERITRTAGFTVQ